ncbi:MAG: hypothetical protein JRH18_21940 [Deltaproteobacteria bacterium]|nr:hypothetical protein [Deltaproteobacteria bacterium]MBW2154313.1 hypothetical protein [Deltaproteobacteria bacterium]
MKKKPKRNDSRTVVSSEKMPNRDGMLLEERKKILSDPPQKALERILNAPEPAALVHSFPEEDFYYLLHEIGPEDALPLMSLASDRQWEHILDREAWKKDRIELSCVTRWLELMLKCDAVRCIKWFIEQKTDFIEFYLFKNIEIAIREPDQDPSDLPDDFFTFDDTFYIRILDLPPDAPLDEKADKERKETIKRFLDHMAVYDYKKYQRVLLETTGIIPAETEEECYRLRNVRLAEKGFLPFEEAMGVYQPVRAEDLKKQTPKHILTEEAEVDLSLPVPFYPTNMMDSENLFAEALRNITPTVAMEQLQSEFAALCNQVAVADQKDIKEKEQLRPVVKKASGYLSIALEELTKDQPHRRLEKASAFIVRYPLNQIFRLGFGYALQLKWRAESWKKQAWFKRQGLPLSFWGEQWLGVLGGLLIKKPLFYDNYKTGELYREFQSLEDIKQTESTLNEIIAFDDFLSHMEIELHQRPRRFMTYKNFLLTLWAHSYLGLSEQLHPLKLDEFRRFFDELFENPEADALEVPRKTKIRMKESFLNWLSEKSGYTPYKVSQQLGKILEDLFTEIESEYGRVARKDLDPRFIYLFLVEK